MTRVTKYWLERDGVTWLMNNSTKDWIGSSASSSSIGIWRWQWVSWIKKALIPDIRMNNTVSTLVHWWRNVAYLMYIVYILVYPCICVSTFACSLFCVCIAFKLFLEVFHCFMHFECEYWWAALKCTHCDYLLSLLQMHVWKHLLWWLCTLNCSKSKYRRNLGHIYNIKLRKENAWL